MKKSDSNTKKVKRVSAKSSSSASRRVRIYNPVTHSYYKLRRRSTSAGNRGSIIAKWSSENLKKNK